MISVRSVIRTSQLLILGLFLSGLALLPWWRNHDRLRDFYDYGLFINVNARLAQGQRPYVDFTTPAQSATLLLDYAAERLGGGTYLGMTCGAAVLIVAGVFGLGLVLARRWPPMLAMPIAGAIILGSASQHTIIFYNPLGVIALALVAWSFAVAPVLSRANLGWNLLAALGLLLGGLNKLNYHGLACTMAAGWILFAWATRRASLRQLGGSLLLIILCGVIFPIAIELAWTGAGWRLWYHNVVELPMQARGGRISLLLDSRLYLSAVHDYYGDLRLPQVGLVGAVVPLAALLAAWRNRQSESVWVRRLFAALATIFCALGSLALLLTNNEIIYLALSASVVFMISLWLGFDLRPSGGWFLAGILLPALLLGVLGGESAWRGQRSQFGHSQAPRDSYMESVSVSPDFEYVRGLRLPPELVHSLAAVAQWRQSLPPADRTGVFYGPGAEWLEHIWPVRKVPGLPLVPSAFDGPHESSLLKESVVGGETYNRILVIQAWDNWHADVDKELSRRFLKEKIGTDFFFYTKLPAGVLWGRPFEFFPGIGGNVSSTHVTSSMSMRTLADGRRYLGTTGQLGRMTLHASSFRVSSEVVMQRTGPGPAPALPVHYEIYAVAGENQRYLRWQADLVLPADQDEMVIPTDRIDSSGLPLEFVVTVPLGLAGHIAAGWRGPTLWDTVEQAGPPPVLQAGASPVNAASRDFLTALLPETMASLTGSVRNAWLQDGICRLPPGGEIWIQLEGMYRDIVVSARLLDRQTKEPVPRLRVVYYKGGRLEMFHPSHSGDAGSLRYMAWSPENGGWLGILADPHPAMPMLGIRIESAIRQ